MYSILQGWCKSTHLPCKYAYMCVCMYVVCTCMHIHTIHACVHIYSSTYKYTCIHTYVWYIHTGHLPSTHHLATWQTTVHLYIYIHTYIHTVHTYIHTYIQANCLPHTTWLHGKRLPTYTYIYIHTCILYIHTHIHTYIHTYRRTAFHTPHGYMANDCPPIHGVFKTSRMKQFEKNLYEVSSTVCMYICLYVCMYVCMRMFLYCMYMSAPLCIYTWRF